MNQGSERQGEGFEVPKVLWHKGEYYLLSPHKNGTFKVSTFLFTTALPYSYSRVCFARNKIIPGAKIQQPITLYQTQNILYGKYSDVSHEHISTDIKWKGKCIWKLYFQNVSLYIRGQLVR